MEKYAMTPPRRLSLFLALAALLVPLAGNAQVLGSVAGSVRDASGAVLPGVTVEAASPALIEKVRSAVTDGSGQYTIVNLPPGTYSVSFTLPGFSTVKREGLLVSVNFTSNVDAEMRVGAVEETITVTGESPIVDLQSSATTRQVTDQAFKELPSGGSWVQLAALMPAVRASNVDVGGVLGDQTGAAVSANGSRSADGVSMIDGLRIGNMYISSNLTNMSLSPLLFDQVDVQLSGQQAETGTNGVIMNAIPKSGGNRFSGSALANGSGPSLQGDNITSRLNDRGLAGASSTLKKLYDINGAIGGPIKQDKVWFYATSRYFTNEYFLAGRFFPVDPDGGAAAERHVAAGLRRHLHLRQQRAHHLGHQREAEDLRVVRLSVQGRSLVAAAERQRVAGIRRASPPGTRSSRPRSGPTRPPTGCCSRRASPPAPALTPSCSIRTRWPPARRRGAWRRAASAS